MNIKSIFHSIDLWNNKILRAKCDTPVQDEHIVNKKYVDDITTYDTEKAQKYQNPFLQWWMKNVFGKSFKELFDDLLFPRLSPTYTNPSFKSMTFVETGVTTLGTQVCNGKKLMFHGLNYNLRFTVNFNNENVDRDSGKLTSLRIKYPSSLGLEDLVFYSTTTADDTVTINTTSVTFHPGMTLTIEKTYNRATTKNDTYGDPDIPTEFTVPWTLTEDITNLFYDNIIQYPSLFVQKKSTSTPASIVDGSSVAVNTLLGSGYTRSNNLQVLKDTWTYYNLLMSTSLFEKTKVVLDYYRENRLFNEVRLMPPMLVDTENEVHFDVTAEDGTKTNYIVCNINLGITNANYVARIMFDFIFNAE